MDRNRAAVLGSPIAHSLSPVIHQCAYEMLKWDWVYERHEVSSGLLSDFLEHNYGEFRGLSLTMPLKEEAVGLLETVSDLAKRVNAVNTIVFDDFGGHGHNTDVQGFIDAMGHYDIAIPEVVSILGAGATARAAVAAIDRKATRINVYARSEHRTRAIVNSAEQAIVSVLPWEKVDSAFSAQLVIGTTPKGANDLVEISEVAGAGTTYFESLYNPWPTPLLSRCRQVGMRTLDGLDLLVWQAIGQLELMNPEADLSNRRDDLHAAMREAALRSLTS